MNSLDKQYQNLLQDILDNGTIKEDRTGTGTTSLFGRTIRHHMRDGFPLLTTKKMYLRGIVAELLWFINGSTNIQWLVQNKCNIWNGDAYKKYLIEDAKYMPNMPEEKLKAAGFRLNKKEFAERIRTNDAFAKEYGDLGPIYGEQWRNFGGTKTAIEVDDKGNPTRLENTDGIDQFANMINSLKSNPDGRRIMVSAWNPQNVHLATLPPCHYGFQVYTRELSIKERTHIWFHTSKPNRDVVDNFDTLSDESKLHYLDDPYYDIPKREVSLLWNQRSVDTFLGLPFNIASYGLLLEMIAKEVNMVPGEIVGFLGDTHLYSDHLEVAREQISRKPEELPTLTIGLDDGQKFDIYNMNIDNFQVANYFPHEAIKANLSN